MIHMHNGDWQNALETYELAFSIHPYLANVEMIIENLKSALEASHYKSAHHETGHEARHLQYFGIIS